jgi:hypothetical protein
VGDDDKGTEAADTAIEMVDLLRQLPKPHLRTSAGD